VTKPKQRPPEPPDDDEIDEGGEPVADALLSAIDEARGDDGSGTVRVERLNADRKWEFVDEMDSGAFAVRDVHRAWGGGMYRFTVRNAKGQYVHTSRRPLAGVSKTPEAPKPAADRGTASTSPDLAQVIRDALAEQTRAFTAALAHARPEPTLAARAEELRTLRDLFAPAPSALAPDKALELIKSGIEFGREVSGGEGDPWQILARAVDTIADPVKALLSRVVAAPAAESVNGSRTPALAERAARGPAAASKTSLAGFLQLLVNRAEDDADPDLWAAALVDIMPEDELRGFVARPDPVGELAGLDPRVALHRQWFEEILTLLKGHYATEHGTAAESDGDTRAPT